MKRIICCGSSGFIGTHLIRRLRAEGHYVIGIDRKLPQFGPVEADEFLSQNLDGCELWHGDLWGAVDEVYQLAAEMGGAGYLFTGAHDAEVMATNARINLNVLEAVHRFKIPRVFFASSACVYPSMDRTSVIHSFNYMTDGSMTQETIPMACREKDAYPAVPDSEYGWEKLFSERLYLAYHRNYGTNVRIGRFHNVFGEEGAWRGGREKAPAAICRKVAETEDGGEITIWGDGKQTRSFLHVSEAVEGAIRLCRSDFTGPVNIGSDQMISIDDLVREVMHIAEKRLTINHIDGPVGVRGRNSCNDLIREKLGWAPRAPLYAGLVNTYAWVEQQVKQAREEGLTAPAE